MTYFSQSNLFKGTNSGKPWFSCTVIYVSVISTGLKTKNPLGDILTGLLSIISFPVGRKIPSKISYYVQ